MPASSFVSLSLSLQPMWRGRGLHGHMVSGLSLVTFCSTQFTWVCTRVQGCESFHPFAVQSSDFKGRNHLLVSQLSSYPQNVASIYVIYTKYIFKWDNLGTLLKVLLLIILSKAIFSLLQFQPSIQVKKITHMKYIQNKLNYLWPSPNDGITMLWY